MRRSAAPSWHRKSVRLKARSDFGFLARWGGIGSETSKWRDNECGSYAG
jgi:hypothetical protein